jgi:hypothetical protein
MYNGFFFQKGYSLEVETANGVSSGRTSAINHIIAPGFDVSDAHLYQTIKIDNHPLVKKLKNNPDRF